MLYMNLNSQAASSHPQTLDHLKAEGVPAAPLIVEGLRGSQDCAESWVDDSLSPV